MDAGATPLVFLGVGERRVVNTGGGKIVADRPGIVQGEADLLEVVLTTHAAGRFASGLYRGQQERHENANDGNDDE